MIDDLEQIVTEASSGRYDSYKKEREAATAASLALCPDNIKEWLIGCTSDEKGKAYSSNIGSDNVEWFEVGHNASHYFSFGVRADGIFIKKTCGPEYHEECECWYDKTTLRIITLEEVPKNYWGHL